MKNIDAERLWSVFLTVLLCLCGLTACAKTATELPAGSPTAVGERKKHVQEGVASWYGPDFHGKKTSSGETYDMHQLTAAHPSLPMGTVVHVTNLENQRTVIVRINDRGPFVKGRIIDLSFASARVLDMLDAGTTLVRLEILKRPQSCADCDFSVKPHLTLQVGSFAFWPNAFELKEQVDALLGIGSARIVPARVGSQHVFRVRVGRYLQREEAKDQADKLAKEGFVVLVVTEYPRRTSRGTLR